MKVCQVIFSTNRLDYLKKTLDSQKRFLDFSGLQVHKIFIDDYPKNRNDALLTQLVRIYGFSEVILHKENKGITSTWNELFELVKDRDYDYILHNEDDVELIQPIKVLDMVNLLNHDNTLSQIQLKRNPWYDYELNKPDVLPTDIQYKNYLYEKTEQYFWMLMSLYPISVAKIDWKKETGFCPSEGVIAHHLKTKYNKSSGILKNSNGKNLVVHIGEFSQGKRVNKDEPGWEKFSGYDSEKQYCSKTGVEWNTGYNQRMQTNLIVVDNFYTNVDEVRAFALSQPFEVVGNYPGKRTNSFLNQSIKDTIQSIILPHGGKITDWHQEQGLSGSFQLTNCQDRTWIHSDCHNTWAGVCYLTPDAPLSGGTAFYKHKSTNKRAISAQESSADYEGYDYTKWEVVDRIGNVYNRLALYRGNLFHASLDYFGNTKENSRLFQVFFFNTEF